MEAKNRQKLIVVSGVVWATQLCPTLCNPMGWRWPGSSVHGSLQARILEGLAIRFSRGSSWPRDQTRVSGLQRWQAVSSPRCQLGFCVCLQGPPNAPPFDLTNPAVWYRDSKGSITYMLPADSLGLTREENVHFPSPLSALWRALSQAKPLRQLKVKESQ